MINSLTILGSTGSIGTQALKVVDKLGIKVIALAANSNIDVLEQQIRKYSPAVVAVTDEASAEVLTKRIAGTGTKILSGQNSLSECARFESDMVLNSVVGLVGLAPTIAAIETGHDIALANKETLVAGGALVMKAVKDNNVNIYPVDSEHSAIFQSLQGCPKHDMIKKIILTASGGPFFGRTRSELENVKKSDALNHPNWSMGNKITIDSATMMNKGLEFIEAVWLFDMKPEDIDIVIHRESVVHSLVEFNDNSVIAQLGVPDMCIPIQYAFTYPDRYESPAAELSLTDYGKLTFFKPDYKTFECIDICREAIKRGGLYPAIVNGANEKAVELFLRDKIKFTDIGIIVRAAMDNVNVSENYTLEDVFIADRSARIFAEERAALI